MSARPSHNLDGMEIDLARRIDEVCRRFEADWREERQPRIDDSEVDAIAFCNDGTCLASAGNDQRVKVWDARPLDAEPAKTGPTP
jgi:WD40 repeat protein